MSTIKIEKERWTGYLDNLSRVADSQLIKIEIVGIGIGDQIETDFVKFNGITYDGDDVISVQAGSLGHEILHPKDVFVQESADGLKSIEVTDGEDNKHILLFKPAA